MSADLKDDFKKLELAQAKRLEKMKAQLGMSANSSEVAKAVDKQKTVILPANGNKRVQAGQNSTDKKNLMFPSDDLGLSTATASTTTSGKLNDSGSKFSTRADSERIEAVNRLAQVEKDNERLQAVLAEKLAEIKRLEKRVEEDTLALAGDASKFEADTAAVRIVELSKRIRELNSDLETEKSRSKKANLRVRELENQLAEKTGSLNPSAKAEAESELAVKQRELETRLKATEKRLTEARVENAKLTKDLQLATHVLRREMGEQFQLNAARLNDEASWRGRAQQIAILTERLRELETQNASLRSAVTAKRIDEQRATLDDLINEISNPTAANADAEGGVSAAPNAQFGANVSSVLSGATSLGLDMLPDERSQSFATSLTQKSTLISETKQKELIRRIERDRKEQIERLEAELKVAREENSMLKERVGNQKSRNAAIKQEATVQREQIETLLAKAKHDDELIATLMQQHAAMKVAIDRVESECARLRSELEAERDAHRASDHDSSQLETALRHICEEKQAEIERLKQALDNAAAGGHKREDGFDNGADSRIPVPVSRLTATARTSRLEVNSVSSPNSAAVRQAASIAISVNVEELNALLRTSEIERSRLTELVKVLETRNSDAQVRLLAAQRTASAMQVRQVALEKQLERQRVVMREGPKSNQPANAAGKATLLRAGNASEAPNTQADANADAEAQLARISEQLAIEKEDNATLQRRIDELAEEKAADFALLSRIVEETKRVFVEAIRKLNDEKVGSARRS